MIGLTQHNRYQLYRKAVDMRKGFDGLSGLVRNEMERDPMDGEVYIFINKRRDKMKLLVWEPGGFMLYYKRLEQGTFELPRADEDQGHIRIKWETIMLMMSGIRLEKIIQKKRYKVA